jgi:hypothetical protein
MDEVEEEEGEHPTPLHDEHQSEDTRSNFDDDLRELKYQYHSFPVKVCNRYIVLHSYFFYPT